MFKKTLFLGTLAVSTLSFANAETLNRLYL